MRRKLLLVIAISVLALVAPVLADELEDQYRALKNAGEEIPQWLLDALFGPELDDGSRCHAGDTYEEAAVIPFSICGVFMDSGSTNNFSNDYDFASSPAACASDFTELCFNSRDLVYSFTLPYATTVSASTCGETNFDSVLGLVDANHQLVAMNDDAEGCSHYSSRLEACCLPAGTYFLLVDGYRNGKGSFQLSVEFGCEACSAPGACDELAILDVALPYHDNGSNQGAPDVTGSSAGDVAYRFTLTEESELSLNTCLPGSSFDVDSYVFHGDTPCDGTLVVYNDGLQECGWHSRLDWTCAAPLPAGTYVVVISGYEGQEGNFELELSREGCGTVDAEERPGSLRLSQNAPNPFNPTTTLSYQVELTGQVKLTVHDLLGREVAVLVDGMQEAGLHQVAFDGSRLASGLYLYTLRTERAVLTRKMILSR